MGNRRKKSKLLKRKVKCSSNKPCIAKETADRTKTTASGWKCRNNLKENLPNDERDNDDKNGKHMSCKQIVLEHKQKGVNKGKSTKAGHQKDRRKRLRSDFVEDISQENPLKKCKGMEVSNEEDAVFYKAQDIPKTRRSDSSDSGSDVSFKSTISNVSKSSLKNISKFTVKNFPYDISMVGSIKTLSKRNRKGQRQIPIKTPRLPCGSSTTSTSKYVDICSWIKNEGYKHTGDSLEEIIPLDNSGTSDNAAEWKNTCGCNVLKTEFGNLVQDNIDLNKKVNEMCEKILSLETIMRQPTPSHTTSIPPPPPIPLLFIPPEASIKRQSVCVIPEWPKPTITAEDLKTVKLRKVSLGCTENKIAISQRPLITKETLNQQIKALNHREPVQKMISAFGARNPRHGRQSSELSTSTPIT